MVLLKSLEFVVITFMVVFVLWQVAAPLLMGKPMLSLFRKQKGKK